MNVTILGAGAMGSAMAYRLSETGHRVTIWNRNPDRLRASTPQVCQSPRT